MADIDYAQRKAHNSPNIQAITRKLIFMLDR